MLKEWLGTDQHVPATIVDLPEAKDVAFETGPVLLIPVAETLPEKLTAGLSHLLARTWFQSSQEWLNEGVAHFMDTLWVERQKGQEEALAVMEASRRALTLEEPASPQDSPGQPLLKASSPVYYRTKAAYVLWMLRSIVGDDALSATLRGYRASDDTTPDSFEKLLEGNAKGRDLRWFFNDWVYNDHGLPDLSIAAVYTNPTSVADSYLVAVDVANEGWVSAEIPITVRSEKTSVTERVLLPAHEKLVHRIVIQGKPTEVQVNDGTIPEVQASFHVNKLGQSSAEK
jgi:aminopeptidase N